MQKALKYIVCFGLLAGLGIVLGSYAHGFLTNQPMIMSGVAFVRELPYGEAVVGHTESFRTVMQAPRASGSLCANLLCAAQFSAL